MSNEPYFYDSSYQLVKREFPIPINEAGQCVVANEMEPEEGSKGIKMWQCSVECKQVTDAEVAAIVSLRTAFDAPIHELIGMPWTPVMMVVNMGTTLRCWSLPLFLMDTMDDGRLTDYCPVVTRSSLGLF